MLSSGTVTATVLIIMGVTKLRWMK